MLDDQVDFSAVPIPVEEQTSRFALVQPMLDDLRHDPGLEDCASQGMCAQLLRCSYANQPAGQAGVIEVQLRGLDQPLARFR